METRRFYVDVYADESSLIEDAKDLLQDSLSEIENETGVEIVLRDKSEVTE